MLPTAQKLFRRSGFYISASFPTLSFTLNQILEDRLIDEDAPNTGPNESYFAPFDRYGTYVID